MKKRLNIFDLVMDNWWLRHILFWVFYINYYFWGMIYKPDPHFDFAKAFIQGVLLFLPGYLLVVYSLLYYLIPKFLIHKKIVQFILGYSALIGIAIIYAAQMKLNFSIIDPFKGVSWKWGKNVLPFVHVSAVAAALKMMRYAFLQERREKENKTLKNLAELELLKAQIHPHFLFNTLNNLFAHTLKKSPDSPRIVVKLSDLLRFMVYESREDEIALRKEINLLTDYIDLEKLRYGKELDVSVNISGDIDGKMIRPLLLMPLIENSFKHGTSQQLDQKWISLHLHVDDNFMELKLANSRDIDQPGNFIPGKNKGIGLVNVQRRLELLYPGMHDFRISSEKDRFLVYLKLTLARENQIASTINGKQLFTDGLNLGT